jgi:hypothetical protein
MRKHTPGPWKYNGYSIEGDFHGWRVYLPSVFSRSITVEGASAEEADANARLIAAAPDMINALHPLAHFSGDFSDPEDQERLLALFAAARLAIAKAEGR